jgi:hypothetical protein
MNKFWNYHGREPDYFSSSLIYIVDCWIGLIFVVIEFWLFRDSRSAEGF